MVQGSSNSGGHHKAYSPQECLSYSVTVRIPEDNLCKTYNKSEFLSSYLEETLRQVF